MPISKCFSTCIGTVFTTPSSVNAKHMVKVKSQGVRELPPPFDGGGSRKVALQRGENTETEEVHVQIHFEY